MFYTKPIGKTKVAKNISSNNCHECKFYNNIVNWWHFNKNVMKYVLASTNDSTTIPTTTNSNITTNFIKETIKHQMRKTSTKSTKC